MSKHKGSSRHRRLVSGVLAAALALTSVISTGSLASLNGKLAASVIAYEMTGGGGGTGGMTGGVTCPDGSVHYESGYVCPTGGTGTTTTTTTTTSTISCNSAGGIQKTPAECDALDVQKNTCTSGGGTWSTSTVSCTAGTAGTGTTTTTTTTTTTGGTASSYVTQPTCTGAAYFWGTKTNRCYSTVLERDGAEGGATTTTTTTNTNTTACTSGQYWDAATSTCKSSTTTTGTCTTGQWWDAATSTCKSSTTTTTGTVPTVDGCTSQGGTWDAATSTCKFGTATTTTTNTTGFKDPYSYRSDPAGCVAAGYKYDSTRKDCFPADGGMMGTGMGQEFTGGFQQCAQGEYYDFRSGACATAQKDFNAHFEEQDFSQFQEGGDFECPEWDKWCQMKKDSGENFMFGGEGEEGFGWEQDAQCLDAKSARREKKNVERDIKDIQRQFKEIDLSNAGSSPVLAEAKAQLDALTSLDLDDPCEIGKAMEAKREFFDQGGLMQQIGSFKMLADFKREIGRVQKEITKEQKHIKDAEAVALLVKAAARAQELYDNPPLDPEEPWTLWENMDPECRRGMMMGGGFGGGMGGGGGFEGGMEGGFGGGFGGDFGGGFEDKFDFSSFGGTSVLGSSGKGGFGGGMPDFGCSLEDLQEGDTPRGLLDAARMIDQENRMEHFEGGGMCTDAAEGIKMFKEEILPTLTEEVAAEVEPLMAKGLELAAKCEGADDKFIFQQKLEKLGKKVEAILSEAGVEMPEFDEGDDQGFDLDFGGQEDMLGSDLEARLNALLDEKFAELEAKFEAKLQDALAKVAAFLDEKIAAIATAFGRDVADSLTAATEIFAESAPEIAEALTESVELDLNVVGEEGRELAAERVKIKSDVLQEFSTLTQLAEVQDEEVAENVAAVVEDLQEIVAGEQLPVATLSAVQDEVSDAVTLIQNGEDPTESLEEIRDNLQTALADEDAQTLALIEEGTWEFFDVAPDTDVWYTSHVVEAYASGVAQGTEVTVDGVEAREFNPGTTLNVAEGITMIAKTADLSTDVTVSPEVAALLPADAAWAEPYVQAVVNEIGLEEVREIFEASGGAGEPILREQVAEISVAVFEAEVGTIDASALSGIEDRWSDYSEVQAGGVDTVHAFEVADALGMITGAEGGVVGNPLDEGNRAEFAKILSVMDEQLEAYRNFDRVEFYDFGGEVIGTFSTEGGVEIGNPEGN